MSYSVALVFTEGVSLKIWSETGVVGRDSQLYEKLCRAGHSVTFVTYGKSNDADYLPSGSMIRVLSRPAGMSKGDYAKELAHVHGDALRDVDLIKSHQFRGARHVIRLARRLGKPILARAGYLATAFAKEQHASRRKRWGLMLDELACCHLATAVCIPGPEDRAYLRRRYLAPDRRIFECPNWVDTDAFRPIPEIEKRPRRVCFVGRLAPQKQPLMLLEIARRVENIEIMVIGSGPLEAELRERATAEGLNFTFPGRVPNEEIPALLNSACVFLLPTLHEGSPKALYEAMACGLPVVSTEVMGVSAAIEQGVEGFKCRADDLPGLAESVQMLLDDSGRRNEMGNAGRRRAVECFSITSALNKELALYKQLVSSTKPD